MTQCFINNAEDCFGPCKCGERKEQMQSRTVVYPNRGVSGMRAMALSLITNGLIWRHHGIGVLQGYLAEGSDPEVRLHIWSRKLLKDGMDVSGDIHDHRFQMISHVLCGVVHHEEITPHRAPHGTYRAMALTHARAAADNKFHGPTTPLEGTFGVWRHLHTINSGETYEFAPRTFHRSVLMSPDVAVTLVEKHGQQDIPARILYPAEFEPVMAFGHEPNASLMNSLVDEARDALKRSLS